MFSCPHCTQGLLPQRGPKGVIYICPSCGGRAASLGVLRKVFGPERVAAIWSDSLRVDTEPGCDCPVCQTPGVRVTWPEQGQPVTLDLCRRCEFVWFDPSEFESLEPTQPKRALGDIHVRELPEDLREELAMIKVREIAREASQSNETPELTLGTVPAYFGLPVEIEDAGGERAPVATYGLASAIAMISLFAFFLKQFAGVPIFQDWGLIPAQAGRAHGLTFLTSFFLHANSFHLLGNLYFLIVFGRHVESYLGPWRWLAIMAAAALAGDFLDIACRFDSTLPMIGASGGISGLLAFYALQFPHARLGMMIGTRFFFRWINLPAWGAFALWILMQLWGAYLELEQQGNVASLAHLGGVAAGVGTWFLWRKLDAEPAGLGNPPGVQIP